MELEIVGGDWSGDGSDLFHRYNYDVNYYDDEFHGRGDPIKLRWDEHDGWIMEGLNRNLTWPGIISGEAYIRET